MFLFFITLFALFFSFSTPYLSFQLPPPSPSLSVLENMSGQGSTVGGRFCELRSIIDRVRDQTRVGVCLDTCHAFAAGQSLLKGTSYTLPSTHCCDMNRNADKMP